MSNDLTRIQIIIGSLLEKTKNNMMQWEPGLGEGNFQSRFGDYIVQMKRSKMFGAEKTSMTVTKLDGNLITLASSFPSIIGGSLPTSTHLDVQTQDQLDKLYAAVDKRSSELDGLIALLKK